MISESAVSFQQNRLIVVINSKTNVLGVMFSSWNEVGFFLFPILFLQQQVSMDVAPS